jgi:hypothetical protein
MRRIVWIVDPVRNIAPDLTDPRGAVILLDPHDTYAAGALAPLDTGGDRSSRLQQRQPSETLSNIVRLIQRQFAVDVCSVYLLEPDRSTLVLAATSAARNGHRARAHATTEGLVGLTRESVRPVVVQDAATHPRFKYFHEA